MRMQVIQMKDDCGLVFRTTSDGYLCMGYSKNPRREYANTGGVRSTMSSWSPWKLPQHYEGDDWNKDLFFCEVIYGES